MSSRKLLIILSITLMTALLLGSTPAQGWPGDGSIYVMQVSDAPVIDGNIDSGEWTTDEETFRDTMDGLSYPEAPGVNSITFDLVVLQDTDNLFVKVEIIEGLATPSDNISLGLAWGNELLLPTMQGTFDRKVAYYNGSATEKIDLVGCLYIDQELCTDSYNFNPGIPDQTVDFNAEYGINQGNVVFEFSMPKSPVNTTEDIEYQDTVTNLRLVVNPGNNMAKNADVGHSGKGSAILYLQDDPRAFFQPPEGPIDTMTLIFNSFLALLITGMFLSFILTRVNDSLAERSWKVEVSEEMATKSVLMEMAYYNSSFLSLAFVTFFMVYAVIGILYGLWASWMELVAINAIPLIVGLIAMVMLVQDNFNPQDSDRQKLGVDVSESNSFWIVPTAFLALVLLMLVFIGIDVIAS